MSAMPQRSGLCRDDVDFAPLFWLSCLLLDTVDYIGHNRVYYFCYFRVGLFASI